MSQIFTNAPVKGKSQVIGWNAFPALKSTTIGACKSKNRQ